MVHPGNIWSKTSIVFIALFAGSLSACNLSSLTLNNVTSIGGNQYTFDLTMCAPGGCDVVDIFTGACIGTEMNDNTGNWGIGIDPSATIVNFSNTLTSPMTGSLYNGSLTSAATFVTYSNATSWWTSDNTAIQPSGQYCVNLSITTQGVPTDICVYGLEGADNLFLAPSCPQVLGVTCVQPGPLEVEFIDFRASLENDVVGLDWSVAYERDHHHYVIEHSLTGAHYEAVGEVAGSGDTEETRFYHGDHLNPGEGINYYRIGAVDMDGLYQYSNVIQVIYEPQGFKLSRVFPIPAVDNIKIEYITEAAGTFMLQVYDVSGKMVYQSKMESSIGRNRFAVDMAGWASGSYIARVSNRGNTLVKQILKQ